MISNLVESEQVQRDCKNGPNLSWLPEFRPFAKKPCRASHPGSRLSHATSFDPWGISRHKAVRSSQNLKPLGPSSFFLLRCFYHTNVLERTCWGMCPTEQNWTAPIIFMTPTSYSWRSGWMWPAKTRKLSSLNRWSTDSWATCASLGHWGFVLFLMQHYHGNG